MLCSQGRLWIDNDLPERQASERNTHHPSACVTKLGTNSTAGPKAAQFENPIFLTKKNVEGANSMLQFATFLSSLLMLSISASSFPVSKKVAMESTSKRQWGMEMKEARQLYLNAHGEIETIDRVIKNCSLFYLHQHFILTSMCTLLTDPVAASNIVDLGSTGAIP